MAIPEFLRDAVRPAPILPRSNINPFDKSTIVSIFPQRIEEYKYTIQPQRFVIEPGTLKEPSILVIGASSWWSIPASEHMPPIEVQCSSVEVADSIISDYVRGLVGTDPTSAMPGLFYIPGEHDKLKILTKYASKLQEAKVKQDNWFKELVRQADAFWVRSGGNPLTIWDFMKLAARELNLNQKPWLADAYAIEKVKCYACGSMKDPAYPVCPICRAIDPHHKLSAEVKFAG